MITTFFVPGKPQGKARVRAARIGNYIRTYTPEETVNYESYIRLCFKQAEPNFHASGAVRMSVVARYPIPSSWSAKKTQKAIEGKIRPLVKPDIDNVLKIIADALNYIAYSDDKNIVDGRLIKEYSAAGAAGLEITLEELDIE